ncbi:MAG: hypothetical protein SWY16_08155 [Cyanobacteriota bacterium]|nr:hypothetical protein [Cyanobacteriota bacterium]
MKIKSTFAAVTASLATFIAAAPSLATYWVYMGEASTGESVYVDRDSIAKGQGSQNYVVSFTYSLNEEEFIALGNCSSNTWYVEGYGTYSPQSEATQNMMDYVCE